MQGAGRAIETAVGLAAAVGRWHDEPGVGGVRSRTLQGVIQEEAREQRERDALLQMVGDVAASMGQAGRLASAARDLGLKVVPGGVTWWGFDRVMETTLRQSLSWSGQYVLPELPPSSSRATQ